MSSVTKNGNIGVLRISNGSTGMTPITTNKHQVLQVGSSGAPFWGSLNDQIPYIEEIAEIIGKDNRDEKMKILLWFSKVMKECDNEYIQRHLRDFVAGVKISIDDNPDFSIIISD